MTKIKFEIKNRFTGKVFFEYESENNTIKETVKQMLKEYRDEVIRGVDLSNLDLRGITFDNSTFYNSTFDNSKFDNSKFYNSTFYNSTFDNSRFDNSTFYNSTFDNSTFDNSKFDNSRFDSLKNSGALESIKFDFFGRMLVLKNEVSSLKEALINGLVDGSSYEGDCCCFIGTVAKVKKCRYTEIKEIKPDSNSDTERWFLSIKKEDTPDNSLFVKQTIEWIDEFLMLVSK